MHLVIGACNSHSSSSIFNFNSAKYKMENEKKNKTSPIPHANDNGDRLTNLQYFLRLASSSSLGRSKAASALSLYFFLLVVKMHLLRFIGWSLFFQKKVEEVECMLHLQVLCSSVSFQPGFCPTSQGNFHATEAGMKAFSFLPISAWDILFNVADFSNVAYSL